MPKKIPIAMTDFKKIIEKNYAFVDKTRFLEVYENSKTRVSMFLRPRRFGKTMFTELLRYYYDIALREDADRLFKGRYIASHPTPRKNSYYILQFDFSGIDSCSAVNDILEDFRDKVIDGITDFLQRYPEFIRSEIRQKVSDGNLNELNNAIIGYYSDKNVFSSAARLIDHFINSLRPLSSAKLMVIIDEYDGFANLLNREPDTVKDRAGIEGQISVFYQVLRSCNQARLIDRIYVTGVLPVTINISISGFVSEQLSSDPRFNELAGFTDDEVMDLLKQTVDFEKCPFSPEVLRDEMKRRYDGYRCADNAAKTVYNAARCQDFIDELISNDYREIPSFKMFADGDIDYRRICEFLMLMDEEARKKLIMDLNDRQPVRSNIGMTVRLSAERESLSYIEGSVILYHLGFLTIMSEEEKKSPPFCDPHGEYLTIANEYFRNLFARFQLASSPKVLCEIEKLSNLGKMPVSNDISVLSDMLYRVADSFTQTEVSRESENEFALTIYTAISMAAGSSFELTKEYAIKHGGKFVFEDGLTEEEYADVPDNESETSPENSEPASEFEEFVRSFTMPRRDDINTRRGRADLVAINTNPQGPSYIFEFKYKRNTRTSEMTKDKVREALYNRAVKQLNFYVADDYLKTVPDLRKYVIMYTYGEFFIEEII